MNISPKFSPEVRDRAIRMVYEVRESHESQWAAIEAVASKIGCTAQTLSNWIRKASAPADTSAPATDARVNSRPGSMSSKRPAKSPSERQH